MIIARVIGNVVATQKQASHEGKKILLIQPLDLDDQPMGRTTEIQDVGAERMLTAEPQSADLSPLQGPPEGLFCGCQGAAHRPRR